MSKPQNRWTLEEDTILRREATRQLREGKIKDWHRIADSLPGRTNKDCRKRWCNQVTGGLKKGPWEPDEDKRLESCVQEYHFRWAQIAQRVGKRSADQCAKRWHHYLDPALDHSKWTREEDQDLLEAVKNHGHAWKDIQSLYYPERSANSVKNRFTIITRRPRTRGHTGPPSFPPETTNSSASLEGPNPQQMFEDGRMNENSTMCDDGSMHEYVQKDDGSNLTKDFSNTLVYPPRINSQLQANCIDLHDNSPCFIPHSSFSPLYHFNSSTSSPSPNLGFRLESSYPENSFATSNLGLTGALSDGFPLDFPSSGLPSNMASPGETHALSSAFCSNFSMGLDPPLTNYASDIGIPDFISQYSYAGRQNAQEQGSIADYNSMDRNRNLQTVLTIEDPAPDTMSNVMDILVKSGTRMKLEMRNDL